MKRDEVPAGKHLAIPTRDSEELHDGAYAERCGRCAAVARSLVRDHMARVHGQVIRAGDDVQLATTARMTSDPEWVTITGIRLNTYTGEVWLEAFATGSNRVLQAPEIIGVRRWDERPPLPEDGPTDPQHEKCECPEAGKWGATGRMPAGHHWHWRNTAHTSGYLAHGDLGD